MSEIELRTKLNVYRERTVQISSYEPVKVSASITQGFESFVDAKTIDDWMKAMEPVVQASLDRQVNAEWERKLKPLDKPKEEIKTETTTETMSQNKVEIKIIKPNEEIIIEKPALLPAKLPIESPINKPEPTKTSFWKNKPQQEQPQDQSKDEWDECPKCHGWKKKQFLTCSRCR